MRARIRMRQELVRTQIMVQISFIFICKRDWDLLGVYLVMTASIMACTDRVHLLFQKWLIRAHVAFLSSNPQEGFWGVDFLLAILSAMPFPSRLRCRVPQRC